MSQPAGVGLDSPAVRARMVQRLAAEGLAGEAVLDAMVKVPRHRFVDPALVQQAYEDTSLPIGFGQTISKPSAVARMLQLLMEGDMSRRQGHLGRVLEIGTGCGYQAAVLSLLARSLVSLERIHGLHIQAMSRIEQWRLDARLRLPVQLVHVDGRGGHAAHGPFDSIIAAAGGEALPEAWLTQLAPGGRLVAPLVEGAGQVLAVVDHRMLGGRSMLEHSRREAVSFVPLKSGLG